MVGNLADSFSLLESLLACEGECEDVPGSSKGSFSSKAADMRTSHDLGGIRWERSERRRKKAEDCRQEFFVRRQEVLRSERMAADTIKCAKTVHEVQQAVVLQNKAMVLPWA